MIDKLIDQIEYDLKRIEEKNKKLEKELSELEEEVKKYTPSQFREMWSTFKSEPLRVMIREENRKERKRRDFNKATIFELIKGN